MFVALNLLVEPAGSRVLRPQPPRGTPSRIQRLRLRRCFQHDVRIRGGSVTAGISPVSAPISASSQVPFPSGSRRSLRNASSNGYATLRDAPASIFQDDLLFLDNLLDSFPDGPPGLRIAQSSPSLDISQDVHVHFQRALKALQQQDTRALLIHLRRITLLSEPDIRRTIKALPRSTLTEFFRLLDPFRVARDTDPTDGTRISKGMYVMLNLQSTIDEWGIRKLYVRLLERMMWLATFLMGSGLVLKPEEYLCLMRCAGAAADIRAARFVLYQAQQTGQLYWKRSDLYCEFIRARFLTEPLYRGYNKALMAVRARDMHLSKIKLSKYRLKYLDRLRLRLRKKTILFGLNKEMDYAEDLTRQVRKPKPAFRLFRYICTHGRHMLNERLVCAFIIALAQNGSLRMIGSYILDNFFGIKVKRLNLDHITIVDPEKNIHIVPRTRQTRMRFRPTILLMETVAQAYGLNGEIAIAVEVVDYISRTFEIPVPLKVWQSLLEWTHVSSTAPFSTAWKKVNMDTTKVPPPGAIEILWSTMTAPPYNVRPGFDQYIVLIRNLLGRHKLEPAVAYIREARRLYVAQCHEFEDAVFEYVQALRSGLSGVAISAPLHRYERARFRKQSMWYDLQSCTRRALLRWRPMGTAAAVSDGVTDTRSRISYRMIPDFVQEFSGAQGKVGNVGGSKSDAIGDGSSDDLLPHPVRYRTPTGYVQLVDPSREFVRLVHADSRAVDVPIRVSPSKFASLKLSPDDLIETGAWIKPGHNVRHRVRQKRVTVLSRHSLAPMRASKLDPLFLLSGAISRLRTVRKPFRPPTDIQEEAAWEEAVQYLDKQEETNKQPEPQPQQQRGARNGQDNDDEDDEDDEDYF